MEDVLVVGAGPAGLLAALRLRELQTAQAIPGARVQLIDARRELGVAPSDAASGNAGRSALSVTLNARGLAALGPQRRAVEARGTWLDGLAWHHGPHAVHRRKYGQGNGLLSVPRHALTRVLVDAALAAGVELRLGERVDAVPLAGLLVVADGAGSRLRGMLLGPPRAEPVEPDAWALSPAGGGGGGGVRAHDPGLSYARLATALPAGSELEMWTSTTSSGGLLFALGLPNQRGELELALYAAPEVLAQPAAALQALNLPDTTTLLSIEPLRTTLSSQLVARDADTVAVLVGDAASTRLPFLGLGANLALEDAAKLVDALRNDHLTPALARYERQRLPELQLACELSHREMLNMARRTPPPPAAAAAAAGPAGRCAAADATEEQDLFEAVSFSTEALQLVVERLRSGLPASVASDAASGVELFVRVGQRVARGQPLWSVDSVKTRRVHLAHTSGIVTSATLTSSDAVKVAPDDLQHLRADLQEKEEVVQVDGERLQAELTSRGVRSLGRFVSARSTTASTMADAAREVAHGAPHGSLFLAERQVAGRGRQGRAWRSPATGNVYMTLLLRDPRRALALAAPAAVCQALRSLGLCGAMVKWPNDVVVGGRKIAGMLIERHDQLNDGRDDDHAARSRGLVALGIGINVREQFPAGSLATSVADELQRQQEEQSGEEEERGRSSGLPAREAVIAAVCARLEGLLGAPEQLVAAVAQLDALRGRLVRVTSKSGGDVVPVERRDGARAELAAPVFGIARGVDASGRLVLQPVPSSTPTTEAEAAAAAEEEEVLLAQDDCSVRAARSALVYAGPGADSLCVAMTLRMLREQVPELLTRPVPAEELVSERAWEASCALVAVPGGADRPMCAALGAAGQRRLRAFVESGGRYLGLCAGAYFACEAVTFDRGGPLEVVEPREMRLLKAEAEGPVLPGFRYADPAGAWACCVRLATLDGDGDGDEKEDGGAGDGEAWAYFNGGCRFKVEHEAGRARVLARYAHDASAAAVSVAVGSGRAVLCGAHPEFDPMAKGEWPPVQEEAGKEGGGARAVAPHVAFGSGLRDKLEAEDASRRRLLRAMVGALELAL